ncbi:MAG: hypothetical protein LBS84_04250 [Clostridiales bacterium]|nr:hypothetical protein [Clostridiales bacterium]
MPAGAGFCRDGHNAVGQRREFASQTAYVTVGLPKSLGIDAAAEGFHYILFSFAFGRIN